MRPLTLFFSIAISLLFFSCSVEEQPVSETEALTMAKQIDSAVANNKPQYFISLVSEDVLAQRVAANSGLSLTQDLKQGIARALPNADLGGQIIRSMKKDGGGYELVKHYEKEKVHHLIYRFYSDQGLNYHDFELTKVDGKLYVADIFFYITGENFSKSLGDFVNNVERAGNVKSKDLQALNNVRALVAQNKLQEAKETFDKLPDPIKNQKISQVYYLTICSSLDEETYSGALKQFEVRFRHEPNMYLSLLDAYILRGDLQKAMEAVDQIDAMINKDPFLDFFRYSIFSRLEKKAEARMALENLYKNMPHFGTGALELIYVNMADKEYDKARPLIEAYRNNEQFDQDALQTILALYPDLH